MSENPEEIIEEENEQNTAQDTQNQYEEPQELPDLQEQSKQQQDKESNRQELDSLNEENVEVTIETITEAILFASDEPLTAGKIANIIDTTPKQIRSCIENLNEKYKTANNAFRIEKMAGGFQMLTLSVYNKWLKKLLRTRSDSKLSPAALETLAIVAYKQPVIRADVETIRGVACGEVIRSLMYKGLVKIVGKAEVLGRPMLYGTTKKFLETFGLNTLKDLPKIEELKKPE
jgi:segregation and condensation protein B